MRRSIGLLLSVCFCLAAASAADWWELDKEVVREIESRGLSAVTARCRKTPPGASAGEWIKSFDAAARNDDESLALLCISELSACKPGPAKSDVSQMADFLIGRKQWRLSGALLERFPDAEPGWGYILVDEKLKEEPFEKVDAWLKSRALKNPDFWTAERARIAARNGRLKSLLKELQTEFRQTPGLPAMRRYVTALSNAPADRDSDPVWLLQSYKPELAFDAWQAADILASRFPASCQGYLELSLSRHYTAKDQALMEDYMRKCSQMVLPGDRSWESQLRGSCKQMLAQCCQKLGDSRRAQSLLLELQRQSDGKMPYIALSRFAGQVQANTPTHPLEEKVKQAEKVNEDDPQYWLGRSRYYCGRKDNAATLQALDKAMSASKLPAKATDTQIFNRSQVISEYARFLRNPGGNLKARDFLWKQFDQVSNPVLRERIVNDFWQSDSGAIIPSQPRVREFLRQKQDWGYLEEHVLMTMCRQCPPADLGPLWSDLEKMASNNPTRLLRLGWVMTRAGENARSVQLLKQAILLLKDADLKRQASFTLMEAYLELKDWRKAETLFPEARKQLETSELPAWISKICLAAAKSGDFDDAMRFWRMKDNIDRTCIGPLEELGKIEGMRLSLKRYYSDLAAREPGSAIVRQALSVLH
jgi:hypothetical protein